MSQLVVDLASITGIVTGDVTNVKLWADTGATAGAVDGTDTQVGGAGSVSISGATGTITFSTAFTVSAATNYILQADVANLVADDTVTLALPSGNLTASGVTSGASITASGSATNVTHTQDAGGFIPRPFAAAPATPRFISRPRILSPNP